MVFQSLADATRRDILNRVSQKELSISELFKPYEKRMSFAAVAKHVQVLESAKLIRKRREGKQQIIRMEPKIVRTASLELEKYAQMWEECFDVLDAVLKNSH